MSIDTFFIFKKNRKIFKTVISNKSQFAEKNWGNFEETSEGGSKTSDTQNIRSDTGGREDFRREGGRGAFAD